MKQRLLAVLFSFFCLPSLVFGGELEFKFTDCGKKSNFSKPYQGDVFCVELTKEREKVKLKNGKVTNTYTAKADFLIEVFGKKYFPVDNGRKLTAFIGVDYRKEPKKYPVRIILLPKYKDVNSSNAFFQMPISYIMVRKKYPKLPYQPPKRTPEEQEKINKESEKFNVVLKSTQTYAVRELENFRWSIKPVIVISEFGQVRCQDKKKTNCRYHTGVDFRSAFDEARSNPENVFPINNGLVMEVSSYTIMGITMAVDHGAGIKSSYFHLSKTYYKKGDRVIKTKPIARSGNTGDGNLPIHLHLMMTVNGAIIDPEKFLRSVIKK